MHHSQVFPQQLLQGKNIPKQKFLLIDKQATVGYLSGGLSAYFNHTINELHEARYITEEELRRQKIQLLLNREVVAMDVENQLIAWTRKEEQQWYSYDKLILATGASQFSTQIRGSQTENYSNINLSGSGCSITGK